MILSNPNQGGQRGGHDQRGGDHRYNSNNGGGYNRGGGYNNRGGGQKRGRDDDQGGQHRHGQQQQEDPRLLHINRLMALGDARQQKAEEGSQANSVKGVATCIPSEVYEEAVRLCKKEISSHRAPELISLLSDLVVELPSKTPHYALLVGLLNVEAPDFVALLVDTLCSSFSSSLHKPTHESMYKAKLLLRFISSLALVNVIHGSEIVKLLTSLLNIATSISSSSPSSSASMDESGNKDKALGSIQVWTDQLVYLTASALPWCAVELEAGHKVDLDRVLGTLTAYQEGRHVKMDLALRPFSAPLSPGVEDRCFTSDSGSCTSLTLLIESLVECRSSNPSSPWAVSSIPAPHLPYEAKLATSTPYPLPTLTLPSTLPIPDGPSSTQLLRRLIPPRGGLRLLDPIHTDAGRPKFERWAAEEFILDTLSSFQGSRVECVRRLVSNLPMDYEYKNLLAEVLFSQMMTLPAPPLPLLFYSTVLVDLCKVTSLEFPRPLSGCVRELFSRLGLMDPELRTRFVSWLSYHLSNFDFQWPWDKWAWVVDRPSIHPQRSFCEDLVGRLVRLSYWEKLDKVLPDKFKPLLGPSPQIIDPTATATATAAGSSTATATGSDATAGGTAAPMDIDPANVQLPLNPKIHERADEWVAALMGLVRIKASVSEVTDWLSSNIATSDSSAMQLTKVQVAIRAILFVGSKSPSHLSSAIDRYSPLLKDLTSQDLTSPSSDAPSAPDGSKEGGEGPRGGLGLKEELLVQAAMIYPFQPQRVVMVVDRLLELDVLQPLNVVKWALAYGVASSRYGQDPVSYHLSYELMDYAVSRAMQKPSEVADAIQRQIEAMASLQTKLDKASVRSSMAAEEVERASIASKRDQDDLAPNPNPEEPLIEDPKLKQALFRAERAGAEEGMAREKMEEARRVLEGLEKALSQLTKGVSDGEDLNSNSNLGRGGIEGLIYHVYRHFHLLLIEIDNKIKGQGEGEGEGEGEILQACFELAVGRLRSFARKFGSVSTSGAALVHEAVGEEGSRVRARVFNELSIVLGLEL